MLVKHITPGMLMSKNVPVAPNNDIKVVYVFVTHVDVDITDKLRTICGFFFTAIDQHFTKLFVDNEQYTMPMLQRIFTAPENDFLTWEILAQ